MLSKEDIQQRIETEYQAGGYGLGWRFLYGPWENLYKADVGFWGINPGGGKPEPNSMSVENGTAYTTEKWKNCEVGEENLQKQVVGLFSLLQVDINKALLGNIIPFRSGDVEKLSNIKDAKNFSVELWRQILADHCPEWIITHDGNARKLILKILNISDNPVSRIASGWGKIKISIYRHETGVILSLPHLSRFRLLSRDTYIDRLKCSINTCRNIISS